MEGLFFLASKHDAEEGSLKRVYFKPGSCIILLRFRLVSSQNRLITFL